MNNFPFLQRLQTNLGDYFRPEQARNVPPDVSSFVPQSPQVPSIAGTLRGILSSGQNIQSQEQVPQQQEGISQDRLMQLLLQQQPQNQQPLTLDDLILQYLLMNGLI